jgi:hypothetical protein
MAELPKSWGLQAEKNAKGTLDIIGKDDAGNPYKVRTTDTDHVTEKDITELRAADRENYSNRDSGAREFIRNLIGSQEDKSPEAQLEAQLSFDDSEWIAAAEPIVHAGFERKGCTVGFPNISQERWERMWRN